MKKLPVICDYPPNIEEICAVLPHVRKWKGVIFSYGGTIWNPDGIVITDALNAHEAVHAMRQQNEPDKWWRRYLRDHRFRFDEELPAHIAELRTFDNRSRSERRFYTVQIAKKLSGGLYGNMVTLTEAKRLLRRAELEAA